MSGSASPWSGLGNRTPARRASSAADDDGAAFEEPPVQRIVPAASATPLASSPFHLGFRLPGSAAPDIPDSAAEAPAEETLMPKPPPAAAPKRQPIKQRSAQYQIIRLLMDGRLERAALRRRVDSDARAFDSAIYNARKFGRIAFSDKNLQYSATPAGTAWLDGSGGKHPTNTRPGISKALATVAPTPIEPSERQQDAPAAMAVVERSFRCAVYSDGGFHLAKNGLQVDLTPAEHAEMLRYLERMAEQPAGR